MSHDTTLSDGVTLPENTPEIISSEVTALPEASTQDIRRIVEGTNTENVPFTEGTFNTEDNKSSFEMQSLSPGASEVETEVTEEELALIAAELIAQGKIQAQFAAEWEEAEADGKEVANYTGSVGLLRGGTRQIAKLILAGLVWLTASDWGTAKAHADPISLSANTPNPDAKGGSGTERVKEMHLSEEEILRLELIENRNISLEEFKRLSTCKSGQAADLWNDHRKAEMHNEENPGAKPKESPIDTIWKKEGAATKNPIIFFSAEESVVEGGNVIMVKKYYLVAIRPNTATREPYYLTWTGYLGTNEKKAELTARYLLSKM